MRPKKTVFVCMLILFSALSLAEEYTIIVNKSNPVPDISPRDLEKIFLGKKSTWPEGQRIRISVFKRGDVHKEFLKDIVKMNPTQFSVYWKKLVFTGKASPLKICKNDAEVKEFVRENPGAIGYISADSLDDTIKKVTPRQTVIIRSDG